MTEQCDVLIVGGGPGGSSCAYGLKKSGLDVIVLDRRTFPRDKTCAGWVTPPVLQALSIDPEAYAQRNVLQPIHGFAVRRIGDRESRSRSQQIVSYGIRRCEFDDYLLKRSEARFELGESLKSLKRIDAGWLVNGRFEAKLLVGAGGHFCPVVRHFSKPGAEKEPVVAAKEIEYLLDHSDLDDCPVDEELPELFFTQDLKGYGWVFRKGNYLNVGLGRLDRSPLSGHLEEFMDFLRQEGRLPRHVPDTFKGHAYLLYDHADRKLFSDQVLFVGDAAGLAYPRSGEGIRPSVESGLLAARAIIQEDSFEKTARLYRLSVEKRLGKRKVPLATGILDVIPAPILRRLAGKLFSMPWFAKNVVVDRWFVHAHVPTLS